MNTVPKETETTKKEKFYQIFDAAARRVQQKEENKSIEGLRKRAIRAKQLIKLSQKK